MPRLSPNDHAKEFKNIIKFGNNSNLWVSKPDSNKVYKWKEIKSTYDMYKIYSILDKENDKIKLRYKNLLKIIKQLEKNMNLQIIQYFIINLEHLVEAFDGQYNSSNYLGDNGAYVHDHLDHNLNNLIKKYNTSYYFIINDLDLYLYLKTKKLYINGIILDNKIFLDIKKNIIDKFKNYKVKFYNSKNSNSYMIEIQDK
jgi:hypothetical protein